MRSPSLADESHRMGVRARPYRSWSFDGWTPERQRPGTVETASRKAENGASRSRERNRYARPGVSEGPRASDGSVTAGISRNLNRSSDAEAPTATTSIYMEESPRFPGDDVYRGQNTSVAVADTAAAARTNTTLRLRWRISGLWLRRYARRRTATVKAN